MKRHEFDEVMALLDRLETLLKDEYEAADAIDQLLAVRRALIDRCRPAEQGVGALASFRMARFFAPD